MTAPYKYQFPFKMGFIGLVTSVSIVGYVEVTKKIETEKEIQELASTPTSHSMDVNRDGRNDVKMTEEFGGVTFIALPNGKYDKCTKENERFVSYDKQRIYFEGGLFLDKTKGLIGDTSSGLVTKLEGRY